MSFKPRPYQIEAIEAAEKHWETSGNRAVLVLPTGAGKTVIISHVIARQIGQLRSQGLRVLLLAHREELLEQAADKIRSVCPELRIGIVKGSRDESAGADVVIASQQTMARAKRRESIGSIGLVIVDECHRAASRSYMAVLEHYGVLDGTTRTLGVTATLTRMDKGIAKVWDHVAYKLDIHTMIDAGWLVKPHGMTIQIDALNLSKVRVTAGELNSGDVSKAMLEADAFGIVAEHYIEHAKERPGIVFTPDVATAHAAQQAFTDAGLTTEVITGSTPSAERQATYGRFAEGLTQVLVNCAVLIEGFDAPHTSCVVIARPTLNPGLYVQMVGRGLRLADGKDDCLILDVAGASQRHQIACYNDLEGCEADCGCSCRNCGCRPSRNPRRAHRCRCNADVCGCDCGCGPAEREESDSLSEGCPCDCECGCTEEECFCRWDAKTGDNLCSCQEEHAPEVKEVTRDVLALQEVDLFTSAVRKMEKSSVVWARTRFGIWFVPAGSNGYVFILPSLTDDGFIYGSVLGSEFTRQDAGSLPLDEARQAAETFRGIWLEEMGVSDYSRRSASWRRKPASGKQRELLTRFGLWKDGMTSGQASDAQGVAFAERVLGRRFAGHMAKAAENGHPWAQLG